MGNRGEGGDDRNYHETKEARKEVLASCGDKEESVRGSQSGRNTFQTIDLSQWRKKSFGFHPWHHF